MPQVLTRSRVAQQLLDNGVGTVEVKRLHPEDFCNEWIPKLYGIQPGEDLFLKASITEFIRLLQDTGVTEDSIRGNWRWSGKREKFPKYLPALLTLAHKQYRVLEELGHLPQYEIQRGD